MNSIRMQHLMLGALAGLGLWALIDHVDLTGRLDFAALVFAIIFFGGGLVMAGPLGVRRALIGAAGVALPVALLALWESTNFATPEEMMESGHAVLALVVLGALPLPFAMSLLRHGRDGLSEYPTLFMESWGVVVRYAAAALFVGVVIAVLFLSAQLLKLVGLDMVEDWLEEPVVIWTLSGAVLGLGLAIVYELSDMISPVLVLRLLRLLLPVVLLVVLAFVLALPLRGLSSLFGHMSAAGILIVTALGAISLISIAVDQDDVEAVQAPIMQWCARGLAFLVPVLGAIALWALHLRIREYGWTPARVSGVVGGLAVMGYGIAYAGAALGGRHWMGWTRRVNIAMACALIATATLWMTPLINPEAISARDQMQRLQDGRLASTQAPLWEFAHDWGVPGRAALATLRAEKAPQDPEFAALLERLDASDHRWTFERAPETVADDRLAGFRAELGVWPEGAKVPDGVLREALRLDPRRSGDSCAALRRGEVPGCLVIVADLVPGAELEAILITARDVGRFSGGELYVFRGGVWAREGALTVPSRFAASDAEVIAQLWSGAGAIVPAGIQALSLGDTTLVPQVYAPLDP